MKKFFFFLFMVMLSFSANAQNYYEQLDKVSQNGGIGYLMNDGNIVLTSDVTSTNASSVLGVVCIKDNIYAVVALKDAHTSSMWGPIITNMNAKISRSPSISNVDTGSLLGNASDNGVVNTVNILKEINYDKTSAAYRAVHCTGLDKDQTDGTYLPTLCEVNLIANRLFAVNGALVKVNGDPLSEWYWTSDLHGQDFRAWGYQVDEKKAFAHLVNDKTCISATYGTPLLKVRPFIALKGTTSGQLKPKVTTTKATTTTTTTKTTPQATSPKYNVVGRWKMVMDATTYGIYSFNSDGSYKLTIKVATTETSGTLKLAFKAQASFGGTWKMNGSTIHMDNDHDSFRVENIDINVTGGTQQQRAQFTPYIDAAKQQMANTLYDSFSTGMTDSMDYTITSFTQQLMKVRTTENTTLTLTKVVK